MDQKQPPLVCVEKIDRSSPELWPERVPGAWDFSRQHSDFQSVVPGIKPVNRFRTDLDPDDVRLVNELGQLNADQLMEHIKNLQNNAYALGVEEAKQLSRGKFLKIFEKRTEGW